MNKNRYPAFTRSPAFRSEAPEPDRQVEAIFLNSLFSKLVDLQPLTEDKNRKGEFDESTFLEMPLPPLIQLEDLLASFCFRGFNFEMIGCFYPNSRTLVVGRSQEFPLETMYPEPFIIPAFLPPQNGIRFHNHRRDPRWTMQDNATPSLTDQENLRSHQDKGRRFTEIIATGNPGEGLAMISKTTITGPRNITDEFLSSLGLSSYDRLRLGRSTLIRSRALLEAEYGLTPVQIEEYIAKRGISETTVITIANRYDVKFE